ncbi:hypothetical protein [Rhodococcus triatomae]
MFDTSQFIGLCAGHRSAFVVSGLTLFGIAYTARLLRNPRRIARVVTPDSLWVHTVFSPCSIAWAEVTAVESIGRPLAILRAPWSRARERVTPRLEISCSGDTVRVYPLAIDIDLPVVLHVLQAAHTTAGTCSLQ